MIPLTVTALPVRVTVVAPHTRVDIALPAEATVAELLPQLIRLVGVPDEDPAASSGGWLLARLGREAFDAGRTVSTLGLSDGELLYLNPLNQRIPPAVFDDVVDAVASASGTLSGGWTADTTRRVVLGVAVTVLVAGAGLLPLTGAAGPTVAVVAAAVTVLLLGIAGALSRALRDSLAGAVVAAGALPYGLVAGLTWPAVSDPGTGDLLRVVGGGVGVAVPAVLAVVVVADAVAAFVGVAVAAALVAVAGLGQALVGAGPTATAAVTAAVLTACWPLLPAAALRLSRLRTPPVPATLEEFRSDRTAVQESAVLEQTRDTIGHLTALIAAQAAVLTGCTVLLAGGRGIWPPLLATAVCAPMLLRVRAPLRRRDQRLTLLVTGLLGAAAVVARLVHGTGTTGAVAVAVGGIGIALLGVTFALRAPDRPASPYWGRVYDVLEFLALAAVFPLAAAVAGLPALIRGLGG